MIHARALLEEGDVTVYAADLRRPKNIVMRTAENGSIGPDKPVAILLVDTLKDAMSPGRHARDIGVTGTVMYSIVSRRKHAGKVNGTWGRKDL